eukprot:CAMPEP_0170593752 /NCGR_PEP_ID=MMETSP0224-20130122/13627_1 /TAXON_ID=285029 /ORGANISM="Togula jolla, Strain CCCM 725" /LENGTH=92 /DNA_ID=CAMNT_0010917749 /DNA_START=55 /DNA_END=333 /DNA_ORIENTATION=-
MAVVLSPAAAQPLPSTCQTAREDAQAAMTHIPAATPVVRLPGHKGSDIAAGAAAEKAEEEEWNLWFALADYLQETEDGHPFAKQGKAQMAAK